jgi:hypothetical protein
VKVLELFAGSRSIGKEAEKLGYEVFSVDWQKFEGIDLSIDIEDLTLDMLPFIPDIGWASPECTTYTIAACSTHRTDSIIPKSDYAIKCDNVNKNVMKLFKKIEEINSNFIYYVENPRGMMRKMPFMFDHPIRHTVWYCQYGDNRAKPTDIWTNNAGWIPRPECHNFRNGIIHCHHEAAPRGSRTGTQGKKDAYERSKIPQELCNEILTANIKVAVKKKESLFDF